MKIYSQYGQLRAEVSPSDSSSQSHSVMADNELSLAFVHYDFIELDINDYVDFLGRRFWITEHYTPKQKSSVEWDYSIKLYGIESLIKRFLVLKDGEPVVLTAPASEHVRLIVNAINNGMGVNDWKVGTVIATENITIDYTGKYCDEGFREIATLAGTEWWAEGQTFNLSRCEHGEVITLAYNRGLTSIEKQQADNVKFFTRLFPQGSSRNIDVDHYGHTRLQLPGGAHYVDVNVEKYGIFHHWEEAAFSHIYPRRVGTVSSVRSREVVDANGDPYTIYYFTDRSLNFDPNKYELGGLVKQITFDSGELSGEEFEVDYNTSTKEFEITTKWPYSDNTQVPGGLLVPKVGDKYILWNIRMPDEYYPTAEAEYKAAVDKYIAEHDIDISVYKSPTDYIYIKENGIDLFLGRRVRLESRKYFPDKGYRQSRITKITRNVNEPTKIDLEISDALSQGAMSKITDTINDTRAWVKASIASAVLPDIIRTGEKTSPTDNNLFSARRALKEFLSKVNADTAEGLLTFLKGAHFGKYTSGTLGAGGAVEIDADGNSSAEFDYLTIRKKATFKEVTIQEVRHVGGEMVISPAAMICSNVEEQLAYYRCYFDAEDGSGLKIFNEFVVGDQARCQTFNLSNQEGGYPGNRYYWRLVVGVGENYIDLSKSDADAGSDIPRSGDNIAQLGNRTDKTRQNAQVLSAYGSGAPSFKQYQGIDSYSLEGKEDTRIAPGDNYFSGAVNIAEGSTGWENLKGLPEEFDNFSVGAINLVRNSGFTGMYESAELEETTELDETSELYSPGMEFWSGSAVSQEDEVSRSGRACLLAGNTITQNITGLIIDERYILSLKAKGAFRIIFAGIEETIEAEDYTNFFFKTQAFGREHQLSIAGDGLVCEVQIERGTVRSDWNTSPLDNDKTLSEFQALKYLSDAIKMGSTSIIGGLILSNILKLGNYVDGKMKNVTAGISGVYNDDNDVAFWGGGTHEQAIRTVMKFADDPTVELTDEEWARLANAVITHGGRAILSDAIVRGAIYADSGVFRGTVYAEDGEFTGKVNATSGTFKGRIEATEGFFNGKVENTIDGKTVIIDPSDGADKIRLLTALGIVAAMSFSVDANTGRTVGNMGVYDRDASGTITSQARMTPGELYIASRVSGIKAIQFKTTGGNAYAVLENLPTSSAGLDDGQIWRDGNTLKIVT